MREDFPAPSPLSPLYVRQDRRYLRDLPYPLSCDLAELQRQNLRTLLTTTLFGGPVCSPAVRQNPPKAVLEVACGTGFWSSLCHDYFAAQGHSNVSFTGLDILPFAPDLHAQGVNWRFVQHDLRRPTLPFEDEKFDVVVLKDMSLVVPLGAPSQHIMDETIRVLKRGGTLEICDSDHLIRSILPHPTPPLSKRPEDQQRATATGSFLISPTTPFSPPQNKYFEDANTWIQEVLDRRKLPPTPCSRVAQVLLQEPDALAEIDYRRIAIPLGEMRWEYDGGQIGGRRGSDAAKLAKAASKRAGKGEAVTLTEEQAGLRYAALLTVVQMIESMEPLLKEVSGMSQEEWHRWWAGMMTDLLEQNGASSGECLELGTWWARKL